MSQPSPTTDLTRSLTSSFPALAQYVPQELLEQISVPQAAFLLADDRELLYGGAAGGGKSAALLMGALQYVDVPGYRAAILRRTYAQLSKGDALIPLSQEWLAATDARWNEQKKTWTFPSGATLEFGHVQNENDKLDYQGAAYHYLGYDELTQFTESIYEYIAFSRQRRRTKFIQIGVPVRVRSASNPGGVGHGWVKQRFLGGVTRHTVHRAAPDRLFIPAKIRDNPGLDADDYEESLSHLGEELRKQLMDGDWDAFEGAAFEITQDHLVGPVELERRWQRFESMDYGLNNPTCWLAWAVDYDGNLIVFDEFYKPGLPSETAPVILARRQAWGSKACWGDPASLAQRTGTVDRLGSPATIQTEFAEHGVGIGKANNDPRAGYTRLRELLKPRADRRFPDWHPRRGQPGSPSMFIVERTCPHLVEELKSAPLTPVEHRWAGEMIDPDWEGPHGHAVACARYGAMSRPSPSEQPAKPIEDPRRAVFEEYRRTWRERERARYEEVG